MIPKRCLPFIILLLCLVFSVFAHIPESVKNRVTVKSAAPVRPFLFRSGPKSADTLIVSLINQVSPDSIGLTIQHLQDYGTRNCLTPQAVQAQNWIQNKLLSYGLNVYTLDFPQPAGSSDDVIAILQGNTYPDEYVVMGAHYDSYAGSSPAPGADDNASGTAGILEIARILSQHSFDRSIIFCLWSAEEYGLFGSAAYAQDAAANNLDILGYLNLDMCGFLYDTIIRTNVAGPASAQPLMDFYKQVCQLYLPSFQVTLGGNIPGGSDYISFNNNGYMGIFPFEDVNHYSPYIHSSQDLLGTSVNSLPMAAVFARSVMATAVEMADKVPAPIHLTTMPTTSQITLSWKNPGVDALEYHVFRDDMTQVYATTADTFYIDQNVTAGDVYTYAVTLVSDPLQKESDKSDKVISKAVGPLIIPFSDNFENGLTYWIPLDEWGLTSSVFHSSGNSLTDSPSGNYANNTNSSVYLVPFSLSQFTGASVKITYWTKFNLEDNYDLVYFEVSDGDEYQVKASYTGIQDNWVPTYLNLDDYIGKPTVSVRFRIVTDGFQTEDGFYADDFSIEEQYTGIPGPDPAAWHLVNKPNPFSGRTEISFFNPFPGQVKLEVYNALGQCIETLCDQVLGSGQHLVTFNGSDHPAGVFYYRLTSGNVVLTGKMVQTGK